MNGAAVSCLTDWNFARRLSCTFLASARKVPKESAQRDAELIAPAIKAAPFGIPRPASPLLPEHLNLHPDQSRNVPISALMVSSEAGRAKIGTFSPDCGTESSCVLGGVIFKRGRLLQSPLLNRLLFALFLPIKKRA